MTVNSLLETFPLVLVSSGPFSREVLEAAGLHCRPAKPPLAADWLAARAGPCQRAEALAYFTARAAAEQSRAERVLALETVVAAGGGRTFSRPPGRLEAAEMLRCLAGTRHAVVTGAALLAPGVRLIASDVTYVTLAAISDDEIVRYLASGDWLGIPGAYATPEMVERFVTDVEGSFSNLMGVPVELIDRMIAEAGQHPEAHGTPRWAHSA